MPLHDLDLPRVAVYSTWGNTQDVGWVRYAFDQFEIPYDLIYKEQVKNGDLRSKYDVILMAAQNINRTAVFQPAAARPQPYQRSEKYKFLGMYGDTPDMSGGFGQEGVRELTVDGDNPALTGGYPVGGVDVNTSAAIQNNYFFTENTTAFVDHIGISNNVIKNITYDGIYFDVGLDSTLSWNYIRNNKFDNMWESLQTYGPHTVIADNTFVNVDRGLSLHGTTGAAEAGFEPAVLRNSVWIRDPADWAGGRTRVVGIWVNYRRANAPALEVAENAVNFTNAIPAGKVGYGFWGLTIDAGRKVAFRDNVVNGNGYCTIGFLGSTIDPAADVLVSGGSLNGIAGYGAFAGRIDRMDWLKDGAPDGGLARIVEPGRADHDSDTGGHAGIQVDERCFRAREVDQHVTALQAVEIARHPGAGGTAEEFGAVAADIGAVLPIECGRDRRSRLREGCFDQHPSHPAGCACDCEFHWKRAGSGARDYWRVGMGGCISGVDSWRGGAFGFLSAFGPRIITSAIDSLGISSETNRSSRLSLKNTVRRRLWTGPVRGFR